MPRDGQLLRKARLECGFTLRHVAGAMGVDHSTVSRWEDDGRMFFWTAWALADLYGCPVAAFGDQAAMDRWLAKRERARSRTRAE